MSAYQKFNCFVQDVCNKVHNLSSDTLKIALTNTAPVATNTVFANIVEISAGNGYSAGGLTCPISSSTQTSGTYSLVGSSNPVLSATGTITLRYAVLYNSTAASQNLIAFYDYSSTLTLNSGDSLTLTESATILTLA
jgi:hypothetical protein